MENYDLSFTKRRGDIDVFIKDYEASETVPNPPKGTLPIKHNIPKPVFELLRQCLVKITDQNAIVKVRAHGGAIHGGASQIWHSNFEIQIIAVD